jgi:hypothetical protein
MNNRPIDTPHSFDIPCKSGILDNEATVLATAPDIYNNARVVIEGAILYGQFAIRSYRTIYRNSSILVGSEGRSSDYVAAVVLNRNGSAIIFGAILFKDTIDDAKGTFA